MIEKQSASIIPKIAEFYRQSLATVLENPTILFLFLSVAFFDILALCVLFLAPSWPVSLVLAPIIRAFWGERFLHYPDNFLLLPKLFNHAHFVILTVYGILVSGVVIKKMEGLEQGVKIPMISALSSVFKKYFSILAAWIVSYFAFTRVMEKLLEFFPGSLAIQFVIALTLSILLQALFAFLLPSFLIRRRGFWEDLISGFSFGAKNIVFTSLLVAVPVLLVVLVSFLKAFVPVFVRISPEWVLWILVGGIIVTWVVDTLVTVSTTLFYLKART